MLTPILGYTALSLKSLPDDHPVRNNLLEIRDAAQEAAELTRQLLAFGRKQMLEMEVLAINEVLSEFEPILRRLIREDIEIVFRLDPSLARTRADPTRIRQIVMNLALNARDAMPDGGILTFETANISVDEATARIHADAMPGDYVVLAVGDTGSGMDPEAVRQLFEPFFTMKEQGRGRGLGLATIHGIVNQHGGYVSVESDAGTGTTFRVHLPRAEEAPEQVGEPEGRVEEVRGEETVLIVEDQRKVRDLVRDILEEQGYRVIAAEDVEDAQRIARDFGAAIDLLLTDAVMPRMNGQELYARIARERPDIRVLYMSGYPEDAIGDRGILDSGIRFVRKPFSPRSLTEEVRAALDAPAPARGDGPPQ
jgi:CheY-like chemotaxis protein